MTDQTTSDTVDPNKLREQIQQDIVALITKKLESGQMTEERAKAIAKMTLENLPEGLGYEELMKIVPTMDDEFHELRAVLLPIIVDYQQKVTKEVQNKVSEFIRTKKFSAALALTQKAIEFESSLT